MTSDSGSFFQKFGSLASNLTILTAICVFVGWAKTYAYLSVFGAGWLLSEYSPIVLIQNSPNTLITVAFLLFMAHDDTNYFVQQGTLLQKLKQPKASIFFVIGLIALILFIPFRAWIYANVVWAIVLEIILFDILSLFLIAFFSLRALGYAKHFGMKSPKGILALVLLLIVALLIYPSFTGRKDALMDQDFQKSNLPIVSLKEPPAKEQKLRLLHHSSGYFYLVELFPKNKPRIFVVQAQEIEHIQKAI